MLISIHDDQGANASPVAGHAQAVDLMPLQCALCPFLACPKFIAPWQSSAPTGPDIGKMGVCSCVIRCHRELHCMHDGYPKGGRWPIFRDVLKRQVSLIK